MFVAPFPANKSQANVLEQKKTDCLQSVLSSIDRTKEKKKKRPKLQMLSNTRGWNHGHVLDNKIIN